MNNLINMDEITKTILKAGFPKLQIEVGVFKHKETGEYGFCVMKISDDKSKSTTNYIYDASQWERVKDVDVEGTERIQKYLEEVMMKRIEVKNER